MPSPHRGQRSRSARLRSWREKPKKPVEPISPRFYLDQIDSDEPKSVFLLQEIQVDARGAELAPVRYLEQLDGGVAAGRERDGPDAIAMPAQESRLWPSAVHTLAVPLL